MRKLAISLAAVAILVSVGAYAVFGSGCSITPEDARAVVVEELGRQQLDPAFLSQVRVDSESCMSSFSYSGQGRHLEYMVTDDLLHGPEISLWDRDAQPNGP